MTQRAAVTRLKGVTLPDVDRVLTIVGNLAGSAEEPGNHEAEQIVDTATALRAIGQSIGYALHPARVVSRAAARVVWHGAAVSQLKGQLVGDPARSDALWYLRQLEAVLALIARWPMLYPPGAVVGMRRAEFVNGAWVDYRCVDDHIEVWAVTIGPAERL